jgi:GDP-mannose 6-dehydrogenase
LQLSVFGLGYVGVVSAACLARNGHEVIGVDTNKTKTDMVNAGCSPIVETGLDDLIKAQVERGRLSATANASLAIDRTSHIFVCVGTPSNRNGSLDLAYVQRVCEQIGHELAKTGDYKIIIIRSTMLPGSMESLVIPTLERASGKRASVDFGVCINPEFLREGSAVFDFDHPPKTVIGATEEKSAESLKELYRHIDAPLFVTDFKTAEMVKYADNSWHALKIAFANEIGRLSKAVGVDSRNLMKIFCDDTKLNISRAYLRPGFAFGGSCLPKDVRAVTYNSRALDVTVQVLSAILPSNRVHIDHAVGLIHATGKKRVGFLGLSFKEGTDDLRESPIVAMVEQLIGKGYEISVHDRNVQLASLVGANRDYILNHIPHIGRLLVGDPASLFAQSDVVVLATNEPEFGNLAREHGRNKVLIDLVGTWDLCNETDRPLLSYSYAGIAW